MRHLARCQRALRAFVIPPFPSRCSRHQPQRLVPAKQSLHPKGAIARFLARRETMRLSGNRGLYTINLKTGQRANPEPPRTKAGLMNTHSRSLHAHLSCQLCQFCAVPAHPKIARISQKFIGLLCGGVQAPPARNHPAPHQRYAVRLRDTVLHAAALGWPTTIVRNGRHIGDRDHLKASGL